MILEQIRDDIAHGQTYFAMQTRRQELADDQSFQILKEDEKRLFLRNELREHNKQLVEAAQQAGAKVRQTIEEPGGTMPEDLPTPNSSARKREREQQKKPEN